jgi:hypothetical protein
MNTDTQEKKCWKKVAGVVVGGFAIAGTAVVVTLAATHKSAQRENLLAYVRGYRDSLSQEGGWADGWVAAEQYYTEHGIEELIAA